MTNHILLSASERAISHVMFSWTKQLCNSFTIHSHPPHLFMCATYKSGRYAFVMSLSSHFSIQIQNNCVIMNVDTNQHTQHFHSLAAPHPSVSAFDSRLNGCDSLIGPLYETFNPENMNLCTHIQISSYYVPFHGYVCVMCVCVYVFCINNWISHRSIALLNPVLFIYVIE